MFSPGLLLLYSHLRYGNSIGVNTLVIPVPRLYYTQDGGGAMWRMGTLWRRPSNHLSAAAIIVLPSWQRAGTPPAAIANMDAMDEKLEMATGCSMRAKRSIRVAGHDAECRELKGCTVGDTVICVSPDDSAEITYLGPDAYLPEFYDILSKAHSSK